MKQPVLCVVKRNIKQTATITPLHIAEAMTTIDMITLHSYMYRD